MSPEVLALKIQRLERYLSDLEPHRGRTAAEIAEEPYEVERLLELLVQVGVDALAHLLVQEGRTAASYRDVFAVAVEQGLLDDELGGRLADAAGLRNLLVHLYEEIDYAIVARSVDRALTDFAELRHRLADLLAGMTEGDGGEAV